MLQTPTVHHDIMIGPPCTPHVARTRLGLVAGNVVRDGKPNFDHDIVNCADVAIERFDASRNLETLYRKSVALNFQETSTGDKREHSVEDKHILHKMSKSKVFIDGHYQLPLPFRNDAQVLPDNHYVAVQRLHGLKKK